MDGGLLIEGALHPLAGLDVFPPASHGGPTFNRLGAEDYRARTHPVTIVALHTTGGIWPQPILPGAGPRGHAEEILDMWSGADHGGGDKIHSAASIVVDFDGAIFCAADLALIASFHAEGINGRAVGVEMCTLPNGGIYSATLDATVALCSYLTWSGRPGSGLFNIPFQHDASPYLNAPLARLEVTGAIGPKGYAQVPNTNRWQTDGHDVVGIIGHRNQTSERGRGDPGDEIWIRLSALGSEPLDYTSGQDLAVAGQRQAVLNAMDAKAKNGAEGLVVDRIVGPASLAAAQRLGFKRWSDVPRNGSGTSSLLLRLS